MHPRCLKRRAYLARKLRVRVVEGFVEGAIAYQTKGKRMNLEEIRKDEEIANEPTDEDIARAEAAGDPDEDEGGREL